MISFPTSSAKVDPFGLQCSQPPMLSAKENLQDKKSLNGSNRVFGSRYSGTIRRDIRGHIKFGGHEHRPTALTNQEAYCVLSGSLTTAYRTLCKAPPVTTLTPIHIVTGPLRRGVTLSHTSLLAQWQGR